MTYLYSNILCLLIYVPIFTIIYGLLLKMAPIYILVNFVIIKACFPRVLWVLGVNFWERTTISNMNGTELVTAMIIEQMQICPYIPLCNSPNNSVFTSRRRNTSPCCQKCSCDYTCKEEGSCCPDFNEENIRTTQSTETTTQLAYSDENQTVSDRKVCIKSQYGAFVNSDGFMMVASCPPNFLVNEVKTKCEKEFDYSSTFDIYNHTPVTDTVSGVTFKNRFCELCNKGPNISATFWNVWLICKDPRLKFDKYLLNSPFKFAETIILDQYELCNIAFDYEKTTTGMDFTPSTCKTVNMIGSCDDKNSNHILRTLCSKYHWQILGKGHGGWRMYKNYACMLCNGVRFVELCTTSEKQYGILLSSSFRDTKQLLSSYPDGIKTNNLRHGGQVIERYFPNAAGEVHCQKGFAYDSKKDSCRLVMCPLYFFVKNGDCVPMFDTMKGIVYQVLLQADVPPLILQGEDQEQLETAIATSLDNLLRDRLGEELYEFYIWKSNKKPLQQRVKRQYLITLAISGNFDQGRYISMLKFINNFVLLKKQLNISIKNDKYDESLNISIRFNTSTELFTNWKPFNVDSDSFRLIRSYNGTRNKKIKDNGTVLYISPTVLCYRVTLSENEVKHDDFKSRYISISSRVLVLPNYESIYHNGRRLIMVCLDHAFNDIPETVSYIFLNKNGTKYKFISRPKLNDRRNFTDISDFKTGEDEVTLLNRSIVVTLVAIGVVAFIIFITKITKRLTSREITTHSNEESITGMVVGYRVSGDDESNAEAERENNAAENEEEPVGKLQVAGDNNVGQRHDSGIKSQINLQTKIMKKRITTSESTDGRYDAKDN